MLQDGGAREACYFYYPRLVCMIGARDDTVPTTNFAPITWTTPLSTDPPLFGVCLSPQTHTYALVLRAGEFSLSYLPYACMRQVVALGVLSGRTVDKVRQLGLRLAGPAALGTPWLADAYVAVECLLQDRHHFGDQTLLVGEVQAVHAVEGAFDEEGVLNAARIRPLVYLGNRNYATLDGATVERPESPE